MRVADSQPASDKPLCLLPSMAPVRSCSVFMEYAAEVVRSSAAVRPIRRGDVRVHGPRVPKPLAGLVATKTKICDTPRARKKDAQPHIVTMIYCPRIAICRMHRI
jgi:hypothetical protein